MSGQASTADEGPLFGNGCGRPAGRVTIHAAQRPKGRLRSDMADDPDSDNAHDQPGHGRRTRHASHVLRPVHVNLPESVRSSPETEAESRATLPRARGGAAALEVVTPAAGVLVAEQYRITRTLGIGGMGVVLHAHDELLMREVAIKFVQPDLLGRGETSGRFLDEARAMARVRHTNVVEIFTFGEHEGTPFFVMEYVPGITADQWFREGMLRTAMPPPVDETLGVMDQCCRGVTAIHSSGTIHGDIKPSNVLLGPAFRVALTDLGLALMLDRGDFDQRAGTPAYMAPESLDSVGDAELAKRRDVYSLGVMAYECLTGKLPYRVRNAADLAAVTKKGPPLAPSQLRSDLPIAFDACLMRALAIDPQDRTKSAEAFRRDLMQARRQASERKFAARFLVVDDDLDFLALVDRSLRASFPGATVACVTDGAEGLARLAQEPFDLLILDLRLPDLNGVEVVATIRESHPSLRMPILIVTAFGGGKDWQLLSALGAHGFLVKPVDPNALAAMAGRMLEVPRRSRGD